MAVPGEQAEDAIVADVGNGKDGEVMRAMGVGSDADAEPDAERHDGKFTMKSLLWHGGSVWDAWFSCASNQVAQVLLTLPYSFSQLGMVSGVLLQIFYGLMGSWTAYLISVLYVEYRARKASASRTTSSSGSKFWTGSWARTGRPPGSRSTARSCSSAPSSS